jgi:hypothetical protein
MNKKIINKSSKSKIQKDFKPLILDVELEIKKNIRNIKCLCLRGSVSKGTAKLFTSDIDFVLITREPISLKENKQLVKLSNEMEEKYPFVTDVDISVFNFQDLVNLTTPHELIFNLKTSSCTLFGEDIKKELPDFHIDKKLIEFLYFDFEKKINELYQLFKYNKKKSYNGQKKPVSFWCRWTMRTIIRSTNALTLLKENRYNSDLLDCYKSISKIKPELSKDIQQAIKWDLNPTNDSRIILKFLDEFLPKYLSLFPQKNLIRVEKFIKYNNS